MPPLHDAARHVARRRYTLVRAEIDRQLWTHEQFVYVECLNKWWNKNSTMSRLILMFVSQLIVHSVSRSRTSKSLILFLRDQSDVKSSSSLSERIKEETAKNVPRHLLRLSLSLSSLNSISRHFFRSTRREGEQCDGHNDTQWTLTTHQVRTDEMMMMKIEGNSIIKEH